MERSKIAEAIISLRNFVKNFSVVQRSYEFEENANYVLLGIRRAGKSTMLFEIAQNLVQQKKAEWEQIVYINFEDERLDDFTLSDFDSILQIQSELSDKKGIYFFDEIQNIEGWEKFARRMADEKQRVYISGSNAKMLSAEIGTTLGGRYFTKFILPYSFPEFLKAKNIEVSNETFYISEARGKIIREFDEFLKFGGFPESLIFFDKRGYVSSVYQKVLLGDIAARNAIRNLNALRLMMNKIAETVKDELSFTKLHNILSTIGIKVSKDSVIEYVNFALQGFLIFPVKNFFTKFAERESKVKYYFEDNGILNLFLVGGESRLFENFVAVNLLRKYGEEFYYLKSEKTGIDVDFYVPETKTAIQVCHSIENVSNQREIENLIKLKKIGFEAENFLVITHDEEKTIEENNITIQVVSAWKWIFDFLKDFKM